MTTSPYQILKEFAEEAIISHPGEVRLRQAARAASSAAAKARLADDERLVEYLGELLDAHPVQGKLHAVGLLQAIDAYERGAK